MSDASRDDHDTRGSTDFEREHRARERHLRNLQAVARHMQQRPGGPGEDSGTPAGAGTDATTQPSPRRDRASAWKRWGPLGLVLAFVLGKFKLVVAALKFAKFGTFLSMLLAVWLYASLLRSPVSPMTLSKAAIRSVELPGGTNSPFTSWRIKSRGPVMQSTATGATPQAIASNRVFGKPSKRDVMT